MINNFFHGLATNPGDEMVRRREISAQYVRNNRTDEMGWLVPRKGRALISDEIDISDVFLHESIMLIVQRGVIKWGRITDTLGDTLTFHDFVDDGYTIKDGSERVSFESREDNVLISTGKASFVVEIKEYPNVPTIRSFYLQETSTLGVDVVTETKTENTKEIDLMFQAVYITEEQEELPTTQGLDPTSATGTIVLPELANREVLAPFSDKVQIQVASGAEEGEYAHPINEFIRDIYAAPNPAEDESTIYFEVVREIPLRIDILDITDRIVRTLHDSLVEVAPAGSPTPDDPFEEGDQTVLWDGQSDADQALARGVYQVRFRFESGNEPTDKSDKDFIFALSLTRTSVPDAINEDDTYRTEIDITIDDDPTDHANYIDVYASRRDNRDEFYWLARMPYEADATLRYVFSREDPTTDDTLFLDPGEQPHWEYIASDEFRAYVADSGSRRVYLSYYNPATDESIYSAFTDFININVGVGRITGLKFLRDNFLIVYCTNQIQIIQTDPLAELHSIIDFIKPTDSRGNWVGSIAPNSIVDMGGIHYFLATNRYVYRFDGRSVRSVSDRVHAEFEATELPLTSRGEYEPTPAEAFAYDKDYYISVPSVKVHGSESEESLQNNTTLVYDTEYKRWWQDGYGIHSVTKGYPERIYAVIQGQLYELFVGEDDAGTPIERVYKNNPYFSRMQGKWTSVHVYALPKVDEEVVIEVEASTEQGSAERILTITDASQFYQQRAGINLRGRMHQVEITTESTAPIDRITINEQLTT